MNDLFSLNNSEILFNKKFLIYAQEYSSAYAEGVICVLFDSGCMSSLLNEILEEYRSEMDAVFGKGSCYVLIIRPVGGARVI